jgi:NADH:ubiquinone reductase (H+-translocating)
VTLGRYKAVAEVRGRTLAGVLPWLMRRAYYAGKVPTVERKLRIVVDGLVSMAFRRDVVSLGTQEEPYEPFRRAADPEER